MHEHDDDKLTDTQRRRDTGPATLSRAIEAQRGRQPHMASPQPTPEQFETRNVDRSMPSYDQPDLVIREEESGSSGGAVVAACVAGAIGSLVWYGVAAVTGYEIGWLAWGVGAMVGAAYHSQGGNPTLGMATCAAIAVLAIVGGKYLTFQTSVANELEELHESGEMSQMYLWLRQNAEAYNDASDKTAVSRQLAAELWYDGSGAAQIDAEEVAGFQSNIGPLLQRVPRHETYEQFREAETGHFEEIAGFGDMFDFMDILFLAFGVISAVKLANGEQA